jgi:hypothetical protein
VYNCLNRLDIRTVIHPSISPGSTSSIQLIQLMRLINDSTWFMIQENTYSISPITSKKFYLHCPFFHLSIFLLQPYSNHPSGPDPDKFPSHLRLVLPRLKSPQINLLWKTHHWCILSQVCYDTFVAPLGVPNIPQGFGVSIV